MDIDRDRARHLRFAHLGGESLIVQPAIAGRSGKRTQTHYARNTAPAATITVKTAATIIDAD
jgi:hypothetical protein